MIQLVCDILKDRIADLPFVDVIAGLTQPVIDKRAAMTNAADIKIQKRIPVSYDIADKQSAKNAHLGAERDLVPNSAKKSIIYFEDYGTTVDKAVKTGNFNVAMVGNIRLVCWLNRKELVIYKYKHISAHVMSEMLKVLVTGRSISDNGITRMFVTASRLPVQDASIFARYNYDEAEFQYLRPPFEYFAIDLTVRYCVSPECLPYLNLNAEAHD